MAKQKKISKKKVSSKKTTKKRGKRMATILDMSDLYKMINKVQIKDKAVTCRIGDAELLPIIGNIVEDSSLTFHIKRKNELTIFPGEEKFGQNVTFDTFESEMNEIFD